MEKEDKEEKDSSSEGSESRAETRVSLLELVLGFFEDFFIVAGGTERAVTTVPWFLVQFIVSSIVVLFDNRFIAQLNSSFIHWAGLRGSPDLIREDKSSTFVAVRLLSKDCKCSINCRDRLKAAGFFKDNRPPYLLGFESSIPSSSECRVSSNWALPSSRHRTRYEGTSCFVCPPQTRYAKARVPLSRLSAFCRKYAHLQPTALIYSRQRVSSKPIDRRIY